jgi:hypothetical protein
VFLPGHSTFLHQAQKPYFREDHFSGGRPSALITLQIWRNNSQLNSIFPKDWLRGTRSQWANKRVGPSMDREKLINKIRKDRIEIVHIPSTYTDQDRRKIIQDFSRKVEGIKSTGESVLIFLRP